MKIDKVKRKELINDVQNDARSPLRHYPKALSPNELVEKLCPCDLGHESDDPNRCREMESCTACWSRPMPETIIEAEKGAKK